MAKSSSTVVKKSGKGVVLKGCKCRSEYQDKKYGSGIRVMNSKADGSCSCTVCGIVIK